MSDEDSKKWKREFSAGGVVYKIMESPASGSASASEDSSKASAGRQIFVLMVNPKSRNYGPPEDYWTWPKGRPDSENEDPKITAVREVREEGGVLGVIEHDLDYVKYFRNWEGDRAIKFVRYYLMKYAEGEPSDHDEEMANAEWVPLQDAHARLKFPHDKEILNRAKKFLTTELTQ